MKARVLYGPFGPLLVSLAILGGAWALAPAAKLIPASFYGLWHYGPWLALGGVAALGIAYKRGRVLLVALLFALGISMQLHLALVSGPAQAPLRDLVITALVPANLAWVGWLRERGVVTVFSATRIALILGQLLAVSAWWRLAPAEFAQAIDHLESQWLASRLPALAWPQFSYVLFAASGVSLLWTAWRQASHFAFGLFVSYGAYVCGLLLPGEANQLHANAIAIGIILGIAIFRDAYNMAYRDELTGLPQRRGLNELCMSLSGDYAVAMMDVDHFKQFNDTYGHDTGDDVLKMVAAQIAQVRDGGRAFRYGGEEFTVVYPSKVKEQAIRSLEAVREAIEGYEMVIRPPRKAPDDTAKAAGRGKGAKADARKVSVTISIGVADRYDRNDTPDDVIKKADTALYEAKQAGRNRVVMWMNKPGGKRGKSV